MTSVAMTFFQFKDNETKQSVYVQVYDDDVDDNGETMHLRAHIHRVKGLDWHDRPPPRRTTGTGTIYNKVEVTVSINDATATEGADVTMDFVVTLSRATSETVTVEYLTSDVTADAKKNGMTQRKIQYWVIPPQADAEFVAHMEQVLDLYQKPYDPGANDGSGGSTRTIGSGRHDRSRDSGNGSEPLQPTNRANADKRGMGCFRARSRHDVGVRSRRRANGVRRPPRPHKPGPSRAAGQAAMENRRTVPRNNEQLPGRNRRTES